MKTGNDMKATDSVYLCKPLMSEGVCVSLIPSFPRRKCTFKGLDKPRELSKSFSYVWLLSAATFSPRLNERRKQSTTRSLRQTSQ